MLDAMFGANNSPWARNDIAESVTESDFPAKENGSNTNMHYV